MVIPHQGVPDKEGWYVVDEDARTYYFDQGQEARMTGVRLYRNELNTHTLYFGPYTYVQIPLDRCHAVTQERDEWMPSKKFVAELGSVKDAGALFGGENPPTSALSAR